MAGEPGPIVFGPVPSRRLGRSLGVSTIPPKVCSYSCAYCQVGRTTKLQMDRSPFFEPAKVNALVAERLGSARDAGEHIDFISIVPDGEPTLDSRLGETIELLRAHGIPVAVITNASILDREDVRRDLREASWVSVKVDTLRAGSWRRINHPHRALRLVALREGILEFHQSFGGHLVTETMLVRGMNDGEEDLAEVAAFIAELEPSTAYISIPTRPPAESGVRPPEERAVTRAHQTVSASGVPVEILAASEGTDFSGSGTAAADLLAITAVHPMRREAVEELLGKAGADWETVRVLIGERRLVEVSYRGESFYVRRFPREQRGEQ